MIGLISARRHFPLSDTASSGIRPECPATTWREDGWRLNYSPYLLTLQPSTSPRYSPPATPFFFSFLSSHLVGPMNHIQCCCEIGEVGVGIVGLLSKPSSGRRTANQTASQPRGPLILVRWHFLGELRKKWRTQKSETSFTESRWNPRVNWGSFQES